jgi:hypothetical protein
MRDLACYIKVLLSAVFAGSLVTLLFANNAQLFKLEFFLSIVMGILVVAPIWSLIQNQGQLHSNEQRSLRSHPWVFYLESLIWGYLSCLVSIWVYLGIFQHTQTIGSMDSLQDALHTLLVGLFAPVWFAPIIMICSPMLIRCWISIRDTKQRV